MLNSEKSSLNQQIRDLEKKYQTASLSIVDFIKKNKKLDSEVCEERAQKDLLGRQIQSLTSENIALTQQIKNREETNETCLHPADIKEQVKVINSELVEERSQKELLVQQIQTLNNENVALSQQIKDFEEKTHSLCLPATVLAKQDKISEIAADHEQKNLLAQQIETFTNENDKLAKQSAVFDETISIPYSSAASLIEQNQSLEKPFSDSIPESNKKLLRVKQKASSTASTPRSKRKKESNVFEVDTILADKTDDDNNRLFLIRWKGFNSGDDSWEHESCLSCPELLKIYLEAKRKE